MVFTYCIEEPSLLARWECGRLAAIEAAEEVERTAKWLGGKLSAGGVRFQRNFTFTDLASLEPRRTTWFAVAI